MNPNSKSWLKSSFCPPNNGGCIEVTENPDVEGGLILRESEDDLDGRVYTTREKFAAFVAGVKAGEFDEFIK